MLHKLSFALALLVIGQFANGQVILLGKCPKVNLMTEFDLGAYTGLWYQYAQYPFFFEIGLKCSYAQYGDLGDNTVSVYNGATNVRSGAPSSIEGYAKVLGPGNLAVVFFDGQSETEPNYQVLGTDYTSYAVVYACSNLPLTHAKYLWILTRERVPSQETIEEAMKVVAANRISKTYITITEQGDCPPVST